MTRDHLAAALRFLAKEKTFECRVGHVHIRSLDKIHATVYVGMDVLDRLLVDEAIDLFLQQIEVQ